jgi:hypothetical protein
MRLLRVVPVFLLLAACAERGPFVPADEDRRAPENRRAALYEIRTGSGDWNMIVVRIWPEGVAPNPPSDVAGAPAGPVAKFAFEIRNDWTSPVDLPLADVRLEAKTGKKTLAPATPLETAPSVRVAPGEARTAHLLVPLGAASKDVASLELRWGLKSGDKSYRQATTFVRDQDTDDGYYYMPYYDPFWYGYGPVERSSGWHSGVSLGIGISN